MVCALKKILLSVCFSAYPLFCVVHVRYTGNTWWDELEISGHYDMITAPMAFWCGYYDIFTEGCISAFEGAQYYAPEGVKGNNMITIDPLGLFISLSLSLYVCVFNFGFLHLCL